MNRSDETGSRAKPCRKDLRRLYAPRTTRYPKTVDVSVSTRSATIDAYRGGDTFDICASVDGTVFILMADASSKCDLGVSHSEMIRVAFRKAAAASRSLASILSSINRLKFDSPTDAQTPFASAIVCALPAMRDELRYASAGHDLALIFRGRSHRHLGPTGPILGVISDAIFREAAVPFDTHDLLVLATDGISEARSGTATSVLFGSAGIAKAFTMLPHDSRSIAERMNARVDVFCHNTYRDDATIATIRRCLPTYSKRENRRRLIEGER